MATSCSTQYVGVCSNVSCLQWERPVAGHCWLLPAPVPARLAAVRVAAAVAVNVRSVLDMVFRWTSRCSVLAYLCFIADQSGSNMIETRCVFMRACAVLLWLLQCDGRHPSRLDDGPSTAQGCSGSACALRAAAAAAERHGGLPGTAQGRGTK